MSAAFAFDRALDAQPYMPIVEPDDPIQRLFFDHLLPGGSRVLAMAEPVQRTPGGYLTAATALAAFEEALAVTIDEGIEAGLTRAFGAANTAVRSANYATPVGQREFAGITAIVIAGDDAIIGCVPPGQALLLQDQRLYGVPELATWSTAYMPREGAEAPEPLGLALFARPLMRRTVIAAGDQVVLGSSAVGRVMATVQPTTRQRRTEWQSPTPVVQTIERALESSGIDDAYAAWVRVDPTTENPRSPEYMADIERTWAQRRTDSQPAQLSARYSDPRLRRAQRFDRFHGRMIEVSERLLGGRETETLPFDARRRAAAPPGASALERHVQRHQLSLGPSLRCRLPRGPRLPISKRSLLALFLVLTMIAGAVLGYDVRQARANKQDRHLNVARIELQRANLAGSDEEIEQHLVLARQALDEALGNGADEAVIAEWQTQADAVEDRLNNIHRIKALSQIGTLPASLASESPLLLHAGGQLFLVANGVYAVDDANLRMVRLLNEGDKIGRITVGRITDATADGQDLVLTDGRSLFRRTLDGRWSADRLAEAASSNGWVSTACGIFKGSLYLLEIDSSPQIKKFGADELDREPDNWVDGDDLASISNGVDMVVDGSIYVLTREGAIHELHKGAQRDEIELEALSERSHFVGMERGAVTSALYVIEVSEGEARLTRIDPESGEAIHFLPSKYDQSGRVATASAIAQATDFVVDEVTGFVYVLTPDGIWRGALS